ncbi:MAG: response regulator transcription factor [Boseongicola sp.]|nr:response regulator transcription factor [Boseongicola sp.]
MQHCILIIDDEAAVRTLLNEVFEGGGYRVSLAAGWDEARRLLETERVDLVTLDLHLGIDNGLDVARRIRERSGIPIIMITGSDDMFDRVAGLELGADDYIVKPFHVREVLARVRAVLRRSSGERHAAADSGSAGFQDVATGPSAALEFDGMVAVPERFELFDRDGLKCETTSGDFALLNAFLENPKRILSRDQLMDMVGGIAWNPLDRTIDNKVARLRKKIERNPADPQIIKTIRGVGYSFTADIEALQSYEPRRSGR